MPAHTGPKVSFAFFAIDEDQGLEVFFRGEGATTVRDKPAASVAVGSGAPLRKLTGTGTRVRKDHSVNRRTTDGCLDRGTGGRWRVVGEIVSWGRRGFPLEFGDFLLIFV